MRKVVKVEDMIRIARQEAKRAIRYYDKGEYDLARSVNTRVDGMMTLITVLSIKDTEEWDEKWDEIYNMIHD